MGDIDDETKEEQTLTELVNIQLNSKPITDELLERTKLMIELCEEVFRWKIWVELFFKRFGRN